ncbi:MAG: NAD-dependent DNA ligase LigA [Candidatus Thalassarchaeaceae archaeon]|nr:NAD-dependent DNA ligase LigA [Candidatus Thalassarchaeaceae archaeon]
MGWIKFGPDDATTARITSLAEQIAHHSHLYYNAAAPEISDAEFDVLWDELKSLDPEHPQLRRIGAPIAPGSVKVEHRFPMRSLDKATGDDEVAHFVAETTARGRRFVAQPKLDGSALSLEYRRGRLTRAATRGSGERGEDVTSNALRIPNIPDKLSWEGDCHVRGEVVMHLDVFFEKYSKIAPNPRNLAAGSLRQKNIESGKGDASDLTFHAYDVRFVPNEDKHPDSPEALHFENDSESIAWLRSIGITPAEEVVIVGTNDDDTTQALLDETKRWTENRNKAPWEIDGVVFKLDNLAKRELLGETAHHPRWALAWKFPPEEATSVLLDIDWQTGRTGAVTPVARVAPVVVSGVTVENTTLHNVGEVERLGISIGDKVRVVRRGDVIPKIIETMGPAQPNDIKDRFHANGEEFTGKLPPSSPPKIPTECPECSTELSLDGAFLRCSNLSCPARLARSILYWCRALEMDGIGEKLVDQLCEADLVKTIPDLYRLNSEQIQGLERMAEKSATNVMKQLDGTRELPLNIFLSALGLPGIGPELATAFAGEICTIDALISLGEDDLERLVAIEGVGDTVAYSLMKGIAYRSEMVEDFNQILTITEVAKTKAPSGPLVGFSFCITGTLTRPRKEIALKTKMAGGKVVSAVSGKLDYLVAGENAGSKLDKARRLGVTVLNEKEWEEMLQP